MRTKSLLSLAAAGYLLAALPAHAIGISLVGYAVDVEARGADFGVEFSEIPVTLPMSQTETVTSADGLTTTSATYNFQNNPGDALFQVDGTSEIDGGYQSYFYGLVTFDLAETVDFALSASLSGSAKDPLDKFVLFFRLTPLGGGPTIDIINELDDIQGTSADLMLGDGIFQSGNDGATAGTLAPGQYSFLYQATVGDNISGAGGQVDGDMSGVFNMTLRLTARDETGGDVPEPATFLLLGAALAGLGLRRRRADGGVQ